MAEITKITTPIVPQENLGNRNKPVSDQAFDLTDPGKVHRSDREHAKLMDQQRGGQPILYDGLGKDMYKSVLRPVGEMLQTFQKIASMLEMGISASEIVKDPEMQELLNSLFLKPGQLEQALREQDGGSVLFRGGAFNVLRDVLSRFPDNPRMHQAVTQLLKTFEQNVNAENSVKTILHTCRNLLEYMFSGDRAQFSEYLDGLSEMLLPEAASKEGAAAKDQVGPPIPEELAEAPSGRTLGVEQREAAQILKGNLLPLLGEIVVKYNQNERIRDMVMVVVHNIVRVDQGTPEALREAIDQLVAELKQEASLPPSFEKNITDALLAARDQVKTTQNSTIEKLAELISNTLSSSSASPTAMRQAEMLLLSMLQNQNSMMEVLHFILPMQMESGKVFAEMYVDPDNDEKVGKSGEGSRKIFIAFEADHLGAFELSFLESQERVDFAMWCPERLVSSLSGLKRQIGDMMQMHGYTMNNYQVAELVEPHTVADVFPKLLGRRMGVDVRI